MTGDDKVDFVELMAGIDSSDDDALTSVIDELGGGGAENIVIKISRLNTTTKKYEWCRDASEDEIPLESALSAEFGGGEYKLRVMSGSSNGRMATRKIIMVQIAEKKVVDNQTYLPQQNVNNDKQNDNMAQIMAALIESNKNMQSSIVQMQLDNQKQMIDLINNKNNGAPQESVLDQMVKFKSLTGEAPPQKDPIESMTQLITMLNLVKDNTTEAQPSIASELTGGLNSLVELANLKNKEGGDNMGVVDNVKKVVVNHAVNNQIKSGLPKLLKLASSGKSPVTYAEVMIDDMVDDHIQLLLNKLSESSDNDAIITELIDVNADVTNYIDWFDQFFNCIRDMFKTEKADTETAHDTSTKVNFDLDT